MPVRECRRCKEEFDADELDNGICIGCAEGDIEDEFGVMAVDVYMRKKKRGWR
jgi:hypothetical protein